MTATTNIEIQEAAATGPHATAAQFLAALARRARGRRLEPRWLPLARSTTREGTRGLLLEALIGIDDATTKARRDRA